MRGLLLFTLSALLVGLVAANFPPVIIRSCVKDTKVKTLDLALLYGNDRENPTQTAKCYLTCLFETIGLVVDNKFNTAILSNGANGGAEANAGLRILDSCKDIETSGECEIGYQLFQCFRDFGKREILEQPAEGRSAE